MSCNYRNGWDYTWMVLIVIATVSVMGWISYGIWHASHQPYRPMDPREEFVKSCETQESDGMFGVPDVHTNNWACIYPKDR